MNSPDDSSSIKIKITVAVALITAIISGIVGALINDYVDRERPSITLISVGFRGPINSETIDVGDDLGSLTSQISSVESLKRFETFDKLAATDQHVSEQMVMFEHSISAVETWMKKNDQPPGGVGPHTLSSASVSDHPIASDPQFPAVLDILIREERITSPPISLDVLSQGKAVAPYGLMGTAYAIVLG